ncbi:hypothetical protein GCM10025734_68270 [Kitasatospora paranensis]
MGAVALGSGVPVRVAGAGDLAGDGEHLQRGAPVGGARVERVGGVGEQQRDGLLQPEGDGGAGPGGAGGVQGAVPVDGDAVEERDRGGQVARAEPVLGGGQEQQFAAGGEGPAGCRRRSGRCCGPLWRCRPARRAGRRCRR